MTSFEQKKSGWTPTPFDHRSLSIFGTPHTEGDFKTSPIFSISMFNNNPRINCLTNNPREANMPGRFDKPLSKERISVGFNPMVMIIFLRDIIALAEGKLKVTRRVMRTKGYREGKSKANGDKLEVTSSIAYGRNETGNIYIQVKHYSRDACEFIFRDEFWHELTDSGEVNGGITKREFNDRIIAEWAQLYIDIIRRTLFHKFVDATGYKPKQSGGPVVSTPVKEVTPAIEGSGDLKQVEEDW